MSYLSIYISIFALIISALSILLIFKNQSRFRNLTKVTGKEKLDDILSKILEHLKISCQEQKEINSVLRKNAEIAKTYFQKTALVRFNPFPEVGSNQSFCLALLDGHGDGFMISSLHNRQQTSVYAKTIKNGQGVGFELSQEETQAIKKALSP